MCSDFPAGLRETVGGAVAANLLQEWLTRAWAGAGATPSASCFANEEIYNIQIVDSDHSVNWSFKLLRMLLMTKLATVNGGGEKQILTLFGTF